MFSRRKHLGVRSRIVCEWSAYGLRQVHNSYAVPLGEKLLMSPPSLVERNYPLTPEWSSE